MTGFVAPPAPLAYNVPPMQPAPAPTPSPPLSMGQVFSQQNIPNYPTPNKQQGQGKRNRGRN